MSEPEVGMFDLENWLEQTRRIPAHNIGQCLNAVSARYTAIQEEPQIFAARNDTARTYHASIAHDLVDGVPVWVRPIADFAGWPTGTEVHHADQVWVNLSPDVAMGEPGVDPVWMQETPEQEPDEPKQLPEDDEMPE